jgi:hypothetical protein
MKGLHLYLRLLFPALALLSTANELSAQCLSGNCQNGTGTFRYPNGMKYTGRFVNGQREGSGKLAFPDRRTYEGQFVRGRMQGQGTMTYVNGDSYVGQWANEQPNGTGKYYFKSGERYEGNFVNGEFEGQGTMYYPDGGTFTGTWRQSRRHGTGTLLDGDGQMTQGTWNMGKLIQRTTNPAVDPARSKWTQSNNKPGAKPDVTGLRNCNSINCQNGQGYYNYPDGSRWVGEFKNGEPGGRGICYYANGDRYEGEWLKSVPNGEGVMYWASGKVYGAVWMNGRAVKELDSPQTVPADPVRIENSQRVKIWAVIVGVGRYTAMPTLKFSDDDAYKFYSFLRSPEGGALPENQIAVLIDEDATREKILKTMRDYFLKADANDVVLLYFSGHGLEGCFLPVDFDGYNNKLKHEEIKKILLQSKAKHKLCIADACHSGSLNYGLAAKGGPAPVSLDRYYQAFEESDGGIALLMSSKAEELSLEDHGLRQGVFTYYIMKGLKGAADANADYIVTIRELYKFVYSQVREYTGNVQTPVLTGDYDDAMPVALRRF